MSARPELVAKVRQAIEDIPAYWLPPGETLGDCYRFPFTDMAEAAIAAVAQFIQEDK